VLAINDNVIPPTLNLDNPSEGFNLNLVPNVSQERRVRNVLSNSFGFGGTNASLVISEFL
jgi:3-oxoacyl-[acyl-carrier-protein] synthase II